MSLPGGVYGGGEELPPCRKANHVDGLFIETQMARHKVSRKIMFDLTLNNVTTKMSLHQASVMVSMINDTMEKHLS